jgi:hypothetical protein
MLVVALVAVEIFSDILRSSAAQQNAFATDSSQSLQNLIVFSVIDLEIVRVDRKLPFKIRNRFGTNQRETQLSLFLVADGSGHDEVSLASLSAAPEKIELYLPAVKSFLRFVQLQVKIHPHESALVLHEQNGGSEDNIGRKDSNFQFQ